MCIATLYSYSTLYNTWCDGVWEEPALDLHQLLVLLFKDGAARNNNTTAH